MPWLWEHVVTRVLAQILELLEGSRRERREKTNSKWWPLQDVNHAGLQDHFKTLAFVEMRWKQEKIKLCSDPRYILKVEPTRSADRFNTGKDKRVRSNSKICGLSLRKRWACYFWRWGNLRSSRFREKRQEYFFFFFQNVWFKVSIIYISWVTGCPEWGERFGLQLDNWDLSGCMFVIFEAMTWERSPKK